MTLKKFTRFINKVMEEAKSRCPDADLGDYMATRDCEEHDFRDFVFTRYHGTPGYVHMNNAQLIREILERRLNHNALPTNIESSYVLKEATEEKLEMLKNDIFDYFGIDSKDD